MPEAPAAITTGISPPFGLRASNRASSPWTAMPASSSTKASVTISAPILKLLETVRFSVLLPCWKTTEATKPAIGRVSAVSSPRELYIIISLICQLRRAITFCTLASFDLMALSSFCRTGTNCATRVSRQSVPTG